MLALLTNVRLLNLFSLHVSSQEHRWPAELRAVGEFHLTVASAAAPRERELCHRVHRFKEVSLLFHSYRKVVSVQMTLDHTNSYIMYLSENTGQESYRKLYLFVFLYQNWPKSDLVFFL